MPNYCEPFAGSLAVLLGRPHPPGTETVNDLDRFIANFWRALREDPEGVARHADWPVNECDLEARHQWLVSEGKAKLEALLADPRKYDSEIAGWWVWGQSNWIGGGWCAGDGPWAKGPDGWVKGETGSEGVSRIKPSLSGGKGVNRKMFEAASNRGINRQIPNMNTGSGITRGEEGSLEEYLRKLSDRLRKVRVACGDWERVLTPAVTTGNGLTGVLLDPPYGEGNMDYASGGNAGTDVAQRVKEWAVANGDNPQLRIALCGYEGQFQMPESWIAAEWKAHGGYGNQGDGKSDAKENRYRERIWFSPACRPQAAKGFLIPPVYRNPPRR